MSLKIEIKSDKMEKSTAVNTIQKWFIGFAMGFAFLSMQSWSNLPVNHPHIEKNRADSIDTIYTPYQRMIDSLVNLNLSLDSLRRMGLDERILNSIDSVYKADSIASIKVYTKKELKKMRRDSIRNRRDSILENSPRILNTYLFDDEVINTRIFSWKHNTYVNQQELLPIDTTFNYHYYEQRFQREDLNAQYLGISGSAALPFNYSNREEEELFPFFSPYLIYTYRPDNFVFYNTKTPYTELGYWGTLFANKQKGEDNVHFLHTQNFSPSMNFNILYDRNGANGILKNEKTDFRTFAITGNYLGEKYVAQGGYIFSRLKRTDNGGIVDLSMIRDTTVDARTIDVYLNDAKQVIKRNTLFITHTYGIPIRWRVERDSLGNKIADSLKTSEGTATYFGHYGEYTVYTRSYEDNISLTDSLGRAFYNNSFFINPTQTKDSSRVMKLENRAFINIQPWGDDSFVSKINGGLGHQLLNFYCFKPDYFLSGNKNKRENNLFAYFGASGKYRKMISWDALSKIDFAGYYKGSFSLDGNLKFTSWAIRDGIHFKAHFHQSLRKPSYFFDNYYSNHYIWNNDFDKTSTTKIDATLSIPSWGIEAKFGYRLLKNSIYIDSLGMAKQEKDAISVISGYISKNFKVGPFHFDNRILIQTSSKKEIIPLPKLALNLRYYLEFFAVKNVLNVQIGANMTYNTKYYAQKYSPALGMFYNQENEKFGNNPYFDAFINLQWKKACIFVRVENVLQGTPNSDYFSTYGYIRPQRAFKIGIWWPFYIK